MQQQPQPQSESISNIIYRLEATEKDVVQIKAQLRELPQSYVLARENDLRLQSIQESVRRIETDVGEAKKQLTDMSSKLAEQRESQSQLQIRVLYGVVAVIITILSGVLIGYLTHLIH